jgi:hypothetical protein
MSKFVVAADILISTLLVILFIRSVVCAWYLNEKSLIHTAYFYMNLVHSYSVVTWIGFGTILVCANIIYGWVGLHYVMYTGASLMVTFGCLISLTYAFRRPTTK